MIYIQSTLEIRPEEAPAFNAVMAEIVAFQEKQGWRLAAAFVQFTGVLHTYVDLWECNDAAHYQNALTGLRSHPDFQRIRSVLAKAVVRETIVLGAPVKYQPAQ
jgi:hypothetical protein